MPILTFESEDGSYSGEVALVANDDYNNEGYDKLLPKNPKIGMKTLSVREELELLERVAKNEYYY